MGFSGEPEGPLANSTAKRLRVDLSEESQVAKKSDEGDEFIDKQSAKLNHELTFGAFKENNIDQEFLL